ncbi:MAG: 40S ribosomal protein S22 [Watsoniomyces obsoletus]|nr:MAG: 40S ribosomal protein S22 [Watsoniomyces obsoletus]
MSANQTSVNAPPERQPGSSTPDDTISIRIISPSTEIPNPLVLNALQRSCTISELRRRIQNEVPSRPGVHRQRLIHRGRMLGDANETMISVFGQGTLDESPLQTLHLVLRPEADLVPPWMAQSRSEPGRVNVGSDERPASVPPPSSTPQAQRDHQLAAAEDDHTVPTHFQPVPPYPLGIPPHLREHLLQHNQVVALNPHHPLQLPHQAVPQELPYAQGTHVRGGSTNSSNEADAAMARTQRMFQQHINDAQRVRATRQGGGGPNVGPSSLPRSPGDSMPTRRNHRSGEHRQQRDAPPPPPGMTTMHARQTQVPGGHRWQVTFNETMMEFPAPMYYPGVPGTYGGNNAANGHVGSSQAATQGLNAGGGATLPSGHLPSQMPMPPGFTLPGRVATPRERMTMPSNPTTPQQEQRQAQANLLRHHLSYMETLARRDQVPSVHLLTEASAALRSLMADMDSPRRESSTPTGSREGGHGPGRHGRGRHHIEMYSSTPPSQGSPSASGGEFAPGTMESTYAPVYLLSSPTGPYGLVSTPMGLYTANPHGGPMQSMMAAYPLAYTGLPTFNMPAPLFPQAFPGEFMQGIPGGGFQQQFPNHLNGMFPQPSTPQAQGGVPAGGGGAQQQQPGQQPGQENQQQQQQAPQQQQEQPVQEENPVRELLRLLLPLGGHFWLLIRLVGFLFFFTNGSNWRRTFLIVFSTAVFFLAQAGYLNGMRNAFWGPIQRHLEGILPLADVQPGRRGGIAAGVGAGVARPIEEIRGNVENNNNNPNINNGINVNEAGTPAPTATTANQQIDPALTAARMLRDREQRQRGWLIQRLRGVERAIVVFLASLVPGVGERHIAARDAAAAAVARDAMRDVIAAGGGLNTQALEGRQQTEGETRPGAENGQQHQGQYNTVNHPNNANGDAVVAAGSTNGTGMPSAMETAIETTNGGVTTSGGGPITTTGDGSTSGGNEQQEDQAEAQEEGGR